MQTSQSLPISSIKLGLDGFYSKFAELFANCKSDFFKVERLQSYHEADNPSYVEYFKGNIELSKKLLVEGLSSTAGFYQDTVDRELRWTRVRLVELPLSEYLQWEFMSYQVSARYGERILVRDISEEKPGSVLKNGSDFVMFDSSIALRHDYDPSGNLLGGWLIEDPRSIEKYVSFARIARTGAVTLAKFEHSHGL